jgi:hypothetical protein
MITIRMPKNHLTAWLDALRSGKYEQGTGTLCHDNKYCCLGVLEHVLDDRVEGNDVPSTEWLEAHNVEFFTEDGKLNIQPYLPSASRYAAFLNDNGWSFEQLADAIEAHAEGT